MTEITIHTDGSCQTQTRIGGWAAVLSYGDHRKVLSGSTAGTTVNAMELTAAVNGLKALKQANQTVTLVTDSQYLARGVNEWLPDWIGRGWLTSSKQLVANRDLWEQLQALLGVHTVTVTWVPREQNAEADQLAQEARLNHGLNTPKPVTHLMIAGSREATAPMLDYARRAVRRAHERGYTIVVGDNPRGIDRAVVNECRRLKTPVIVAGAGNFPRNGGCRHGSYVKVHRDTYRGASGYLLNRYTVRDRWLADTAQVGLFIWNGTSPGTKAGYDYMMGCGKDAHLINFGAEVGA
ncbi:MAG: ribonuclease HI [Anaerolineae bacterium]|nr:ribonuclease HI [Anaerolineae bacterium]